MDLDWGLALGSSDSAHGPSSMKRPARGKGAGEHAAGPSKKKPKTAESHAQLRPASSTSSTTEVSLRLPGVVTCGSVCSGLGTDHFAIPLVDAERTFKFKFWCEKEPHAQAWLELNAPAECKFTDIKEGFVAEAPYVDILTGGFPCQPFSVAGRGQGSGDRVRGNIFQYIHAHAAAKQQRIIVLENVKGLVTRHRRTLLTILAKLRSIVDHETGDQCYDVFWDVVNSRNIGLVPQQRERLYIVAIKRVGRRSVPFMWPRPVPALDLQYFYDTPRSAQVDYDNYPLDKFTSKTTQRNLKAAVAKIKDLARAEGKDPPFVVHRVAFPLLYPGTSVSSRA